MQLPPMNQSAVATVWEHLDELRSTLIRMLLILAAGMAIALFFHQELINFFTAPFDALHNQLYSEDIQRKRLTNPTPQSVEYVLPEGATLWQGNEKVHSVNLAAGEAIDIALPVKSHRLALLAPLEGMTIALKICFWVALVGTAPLWMLAALRFISPALHAGEKSLLLPFVIAVFFFLVLGLLFAYQITIPAANQYLYAFNQELGLNLWSLAHYLDYSVILLLANGLAFELGFLLFFLVHIGIISPSTMAAKRRFAIVLAFILGAVLTPPDILTQFLMAIPLIGMYECAILYGRWQKKRRRV